MRSPCSGLIVALTALGLAAGLPARPADGQLPNPRLAGLVPSGGTVGSTLDVVVRGDDLDEPEAIVFSHPGISGTCKAGSVPGWQRPRETPFVVTIARDVPTGVYEARVAGRFGLSTSWPFFVGDLPVVQEAAGNDSPAKAMAIEPDTVVEGQLLGNKVDYYRIQGTPGQRFLVLCESRGLHARLDLMLQVTGPGNRLLGSALATKSGDPLLPFTVRDGGEHVIRVTDSSFRAGDPKDGPTDRYRLTVSSRPHLVRIWPPVVASGGSGTHRLLGHLLPGGRPIGSRGLEEMDVVLPPLQVTGSRSGPDHPLSGLASIGIDAATFRLPGPAGPSNPIPVVVAAAPPLLEIEPNDRSSPQRVSLPCDVAGRFDGPADTDWYAFDAAAGDRIAVEVTSERLQAGTDVGLVIEQVGADPQGKLQVRTVAEQDDPPRRFTHPPCDFESSDPRLPFTADRDGGYRIGVRNLAGGSYAETGAVYRLVVRPASADVRLLAAVGDLGANPGEGNDATLSVPTIPRLRRGGRVPIVVQLHRIDGFDGPVTIAAEGLPAGVTCTPVAIAAGLNEGSVILEAAEDVAAWRGPIRVIGTARIGDEDRRREAAWAAVTWPKKQNDQTSARLLDDMPLEVLGEPAPLRVSLPQSSLGPIPAGGKVTIPFAVAAAADMKSPVRVEVRDIPAAKVGPPYPKTPTKSLEAGETAGEIEVTIPADTPPGEHTIHLVAQASLLVSRNPAALAAALSALADFEARTSALREAAEAAKQKAEAAAAAVQAAEAAAQDPAGEAAQAALAGAAAARNEADAASAAAKAAVDEHLKAEKPFTQQVGNVTKANEPKPTVVFAASGPIRLTVTKP